MALNDTSPQTGDINPSSQNGNEPRTYTSGHIPIPGYPLVLKTECLARPDPFTLYFGFFGQRSWLHKNAAQIRERIESCKVAVNRLPTQDELDALVEQTSRNIYHQRLGAPYSGAIGMGYAYWRVRNSEIVAHLAPGGVKPGSRPTAAQVFAAVKLYAGIEPVNFRQMLVWGGMRWFFWVVTGSVITSIWGMFRDIRATMADPRLKQLFAEMRENDPEEVRRRKLQRVVERGKAAREAAERRAQGLPPVEVGMAQGAEGVYAESHEQDQGAGAYGSLDSYSSSSARESVPLASADRPANLPDRRSYGDPSATESMRAATTVDQNKATDFFESDDASPVATEYRSDGGQGSAWDRIRQQASSGSGPQGRQDSGLGSAWNRGSSTPDNERQQRDQAQAEFDRLLEAERNMAGDFEGGEKKSWGRWN